MREFREIQDFKAFTELSGRCYPGMKLDSKEAKERYQQHREKMNEEESVRHIGLFEKERMVGGYIEYDHLVNMYQTKIPASGIGTVAVDLPNKKQGHAKAIIRKFIEDAKARQRPLVQLYPFQPSFYKKMGFGLGPPIYTYKFHPSQLPAFPSSESVIILDAQDKEEVRACYHQWADHTHGSCSKEIYEFKFLDLEDYHAVGYKNNGKIEGYIVYQFKQRTGDHFLKNDLHITDFITTSQKAYQSLIHYLHIQKDQVRSIKLPTFNEQFSFLLEDPSHEDEELIFRIYHKTSEQGHGLMYRIVDVPLFLKSLEKHSFGKETLKVRWNISDTLMNKEHEYVWQFTEGAPSLTEEKADIDIHIGIADFSSLMMGAISLESLILGGLARVKETEHLDQALRLFEHSTKPECWSFF
ncbi:enhanced intracellular survival protein Eis [Halobacillus sp. BBL2006]|uniref:GNAT family N-acetyltransferase n=1 Tax=Halobacillus sp. BBL2006 TaxID=1543706 RepID=UPI000542A389|nr:GNAT family N-acetyltransferase [Halobacillus sp. BBL2006]KHE71701.1 hypothetical protein LD39_08400 [Halobacillus sp. BBL2006]